MHTRDHGFSRARTRRAAFAFALPLALGLAALSSAARAEVTETLTYDSYVIPVAPGQSLFSALNAASPFKHDGRSFGGSTQWKVGWEYLWKSEPKGPCQIASVRVRLTGTITLPKLQGGDARQQRLFETYLGNLKVHELGHYRFGQEAARAVEATLNALPLAPKCADLDAQARAAANGVLESYAPKEAQYDRDTAHGEKQGATLVD